MKLILLFLLWIVPACAAPTWYATATSAPHPKDGLPLGLIAYQPGVDSIWVAQVGPDGKFSHWEAIVKDFRVATYPVVIGGSVFTDSDTPGRPAELLWQAYILEHFTAINRQMYVVRTALARWRASPNLPWPPR